VANKEPWKVHKKARRKAENGKNSTGGGKVLPKKKAGYIWRVSGFQKINK